MTKYFREVQIDPGDAAQLSDPIPLLHLDESGEVVLRGLEELPSPSLRKLAHTTHLPVTTVSGDYLRNSG
jgi:hypothetical protein